MLKSHTLSTPPVSYKIAMGSQCQGIEAERSVPWMLLSDGISVWRSMAISYASSSDCGESWRAIWGRLEMQWESLLRGEMKSFCASATSQFCPLLMTC